MEAMAVDEDSVAALDEGRDHQKRVKHKGGRPGIRRWVDLAGPGAVAGVGNRAAMVMARWLRLVMLEGAGD